MGTELGAYRVISICSVLHHLHRAVGGGLMAATHRSASIRDARKERREDKWAAFFNDTTPQVEATWDASVEALLGHRKLTEEADD